MTTANRVSRRHFVNRVGAVAGAVALPGDELTAVTAGQPLPAPPTLALRNHANYPALNQRTVGWLRFLWEKTTTADNWNSSGIPHPWWDRYTSPVVLSYGRFDLAYSTYALLLMADQTPAWREVYTRIADGLASRYPTHWGAIDWFTQIGDDPKRANYPPAIMGQLPQALRGKYNRIGWTANGIEPWGLQPDPIGADGYLFYRGWFTLVLSIYKYVSGDDKWTRPFNVTGYHDESFEWDQHRIAERLAWQYRAHAEGPHCENTKIWFFCNCAAGLGMQLYDKVFGKQTHRAFDNFLGYARENYISIGDDGLLQSVTSYYDPIAKFNARGGAAAGVLTAHMILPQDRELGTRLYDTAANALGWRNATGDVRANATGLVLAKELGDDVALARLRAAAEREYEPKFFGEHQEQFGWFFNLKEGFPRGQLSAMMMAAEVGRSGDWMRAFDASHLDKFTAPTVEDIDFPSLGVSQAWNDTATGTLQVVTYAAAPQKRGAQTSWRVTNLPTTTSLVVRLNGQPFTRFEAVAANAIRIDTTIDAHQFEIVTGYRGQGRADAADENSAVRFAGAAPAAAQPIGADVLSRTASRDLMSGGPGCPCCPS